MLNAYSAMLWRGEKKYVKIEWQFKHGSWRRLKAVEITKDEFDAAERHPIVQALEHEEQQLVARKVK